MSESCTYSHDPSVLSVSLQETLSKIMKSPFYKPRGAVGSSQPRPFQKQHAVSDTVLQRELERSDQLTVLFGGGVAPNILELASRSS